MRFEAIGRPHHSSSLPPNRPRTLAIFLDPHLPLTLSLVLIHILTHTPTHILLPLPPRSLSPSFSPSPNAAAPFRPR